MIKTVNSCKSDAVHPSNYTMRECIYAVTFVNRGFTFSLGANILTTKYCSVVKLYSNLFLTLFMPEYILFKLLLLKGNIWVYQIHNDVNFDDNQNPFYCDKVCYNFAFWSITCTWIVIILISICVTSIALFFLISVAFYKYYVYSN